MLPTFIGIGAPKAGTTWLANALADHPEVCMTSQKEPDYFTYKFGGVASEFYAPLIKDADGCKAVGEFSTGYLESEKAPARIAAAIPDVRLIVVFRNPVDQIYSHYWHLQRQNFHVRDHAASQASFEEALVRFEDRLVHPARYDEHLDQWFQHFESNQFIFLLFEDIKNRPNEVLSRVYKHIGVDPTWEPETANDTGSDARQGTSPRSNRIGKIGAYAYSVLDRKVYRKLKKVVGEQRATAVKDALRVRQLFEATFRRKGYPPLAEDTRDRLLKSFREPNERLAERIGRNLDHWNSPRR